MKYAIKVRLSESDWIYVTNDTGECDFILSPVLFDSQHAAEEYAANWRIPGKEENVVVVVYDQDEVND